MPPLSDMLLEAEKPRRNRPLFTNQVTFAIYRDEQWNRLCRMLIKRGITPSRVRFNLKTGVEIGFATADDAVLAKMAYDSC